MLSFRTSKKWKEKKNKFFNKKNKILDFICVFCFISRRQTLVYTRLSVLHTFTHKHSIYSFIMATTVAQTTTKNDKISSNTTTKSARSEHAMNSNQVWVSAQKRVSFTSDIAIRMFVKHETVELHGLGAAICAAVDVAQHLVHLKKATILSNITTS